MRQGWTMLHVFNMTIGYKQSDSAQTVHNMCVICCNATRYQGLWIAICGQRVYKPGQGLTRC